MTLAVGNALLKAARPYTVDTLEEPLRQAFVAWNNSPDNNRAPGVTCMDACNKLATGMSWQQSSVIGSKGCGANMRVAPVGLLSNGKDGATVETRAAIAQFQAALTHGHPTGLAAADLTTAAIVDLVAGGDHANLPQRLRAYAHTQQKVYHEQWLGPLMNILLHLRPRDLQVPGKCYRLQAPLFSTREHSLEILPNISCRKHGEQPSLSIDFHLPSIYDYSVCLNRRMCSCNDASHSISYSKEG